MEEYKKDDRGRSKAKRLTMNDPHTKVDSSTWTPDEAENADVKTGARPLVKRLYKKGGKIVGKHEGKDSHKHAGRMPRKAGGRTSTLSPDSLINRDVRTANEAREGKKHVGGFKKGGKTHKLGGGMVGDNPLSVQDRSMVKASGMMKKGGRAKKRADGGDTIADMIRQDQIEQGMKGRGLPERVPMPPRRPADKPMTPRDPIPTSTNFGAKKGGKIKHPDEKADRQLIKSMIKPTAFKAKGGKAMHHEDCTCKMCGGGRAMKYGGGGVFSGNSTTKIPGATGGRKAREHGGANMSDDGAMPMASYNFLTGWSNLDKATPDQIAAMKPADRQMALAAQGPSRGVMPAHRAAPRPMIGSGRGVSGPTADQMNPPTRTGGTPTAAYEPPAQTTYIPGIRQGGAGEPAIVFGNPSAAGNDPSSYAARERAFIQQQNQRERDSMDAANNSDLTPRAGQRPVDFSDQPNAQARGGRSERNKGGRTKGNTTIIIDMGGRKQMQPQPMGMGQMPNAPVNPMRQPQQQPQMPPQGGMPPMPPMPPQGMPMQRKAGGRTSYPIETGSGGGEARLDKIKAYGLKPSKRK